jgi:nucleotide-binding universal stress UspA family protein
MIMKILVAYDGTIHAKKALRYGIQKLAKSGGDLTVMQVFDSSLFVDYEAGPRAEEMARSEAGRQFEEAKKIVSESAADVPVRFFAEEGHALDKVAIQVSADRPDLVLAPPRYKDLASSLSCPVTIVPGTILVPVDNNNPTANIDGIVHEAAATGSKVLVLGVVPVHLYSREERRELERVKKETASSVKELKKALSAKGIETLEAVRSGYPDEEILKAAGEHGVSLILMPSGSTTPSELSKAAAILMDETDRLKWPVFLLPPAEAR